MNNKKFDDRAELRQNFVKEWFDKFVSGNAYEQHEYHDFCRNVKLMSKIEIKKYYETLV